MKTLKALLFAVLQAALFFGFFPLLSRLTDGELVQVGVATAVSGRVSKCDVNRQHFRWYLARQKPRYDFWDFTAGDSATARMQARIQRQNQDNEYYYNTLAYYLSVGDSLSKVANSPLVRVQRGDSVTVWSCAAARQL